MRFFLFSIAKVTILFQYTIIKLKLSYMENFGRKKIPQHRTWMLWGYVTSIICYFQSSNDISSKPSASNSSSLNSSEP